MSSHSPHAMTGDLPLRLGCDGFGCHDKVQIQKSIAECRSRCNRRRLTQHNSAAAHGQHGLCCSLSEPVFEILSSAGKSSIEARAAAQDASGHFQVSETRGSLQGQKQRLGLKGFNDPANILHGSRQQQNNKRNPHHGSLHGHSISQRN